MGHSHSIALPPPSASSQPQQPPPRRSADELSRLLLAADDLVSRTDACANNLDAARLGWLVGHRRVVSDAAAATEARVDALFAQVQQHRRQLCERVDAHRKSPARAVSEMSAALAALCLVHHALVDRPHPAVGGETRQVVERLGAWRPPSWRSCVVEFSGTRSRLRAWKRQCRVSVVGHGEAASAPLAFHCTQRSSHAAALGSNNNQLLVAGGSSSAQGLLDSAELVDLDTGRCSALSSMHTARQLCSGCFADGQLVVVGGRSVRGGEASVEAFDLAEGAWRVLAPLPHPLVAAACVACAGEVFVFGGTGPAGPERALWKLALRGGGGGGEGGGSGAWVRLAPMSVGRAWHGGAVGQGQLFACGGTDHRLPLRSCEAFHVASGCWGLLPPMPASRCFAGCCFGGGRLFVVGGMDDADCPGLSSVLVCSLWRRQWTETSVLLHPRRGCSAVWVQGRVLVVGGRHSGACVDEPEALSL